MENKSAENYYRELSGKYLLEARRFVPKYDEIIEQVTGLLQITSPATILDIGSGTGNVEELIFKKLPHALVTCVEASKEMAQVSQPELAKFGDNAKLVCQDILAFKPEQEYDAILASLVLHNVPYDKKEGLLRKINAWLNPGGVFVWGDLIRYTDKQVQKHFIDYRINFGFERGGSKEFTERTLKKKNLIIL